MADARDTMTVVRRRRAEALVRLALKGEGGARGSMLVADVLPGLRLTLLEVSGAHGADLRNVPDLDSAYWLNHVQLGSCALNQPGRSACKLLQGSLTAVCGASPDDVMRFPEGRYRGLGLHVDAAGLSDDMRLVMRVLFDLDVDALFARLAGGAHRATLSESAEASHVFTELYAAMPHARQSYLRLKTLELLDVCMRIGQGHAAGTVPAVARSNVADRHVAIAYKAQDIMTRDLTRRVTIDELARECGTSQTLLKQAFRESFGMSVYAWLKEYRIQQACDLISENRDRSIGSIAAEVGYSNPSKFSRAFCDCMGMTPYAWRKTLG